jgi:uncharacterized protein YjbJ (UPF0337 family)
MNGTIVEIGALITVPSEAPCNFFHNEVLQTARAHWNSFLLQHVWSPQQRRREMNWDRIEGNWKQFSGKVKEKWGQLTDDDLSKVNGNREQLEGILQERYGFAKDKAKDEVDRWSGSL